MATDKQKEAARRNIGKAREAQSARAHGEDVPRSSEGMSTADKDKLADQEFAFPGERKEPLTDARHVRNAIARFDQVEGVSDAERDEAWTRILPRRRATTSKSPSPTGGNWPRAARTASPNPGAPHSLPSEAGLRKRRARRSRRSVGWAPGLPASPGRRSHEEAEMYH